MNWLKHILYVIEWHKMLCGREPKYIILSSDIWYDLGIESLVNEVDYTLLIKPSIKVRVFSYTRRTFIYASNF